MRTLGAILGFVELQRARRGSCKVVNNKDALRLL